MSPRENPSILLEYRWVSRKVNPAYGPLEAWGQWLEEIVSGMVCDKIIEFPQCKEVL